ncbi:ATP-binding protein [Sphingobacterium sp. lm-10]|uniref:ATP-binding protein n=1 Tax=Sphingobacterium sp. lm-10 TaxID=2944904 RepID=UPI0020224230|nr:ATP-binding protein [Sphingobacterium sp. lm-10]MCL7989295.1 ATP-binding protein [Sphingobacterium sp. lm-10]
MAVNHVLCENEPIQFVGRIQSFGKLIILDHKQCIIGFSENWDYYLGEEDLAVYLGEPADKLFTRFAAHASEKLIAFIDGIPLTGDDRHVMPLQLDGYNYIVKAYRVEQHLHVELEDVGDVNEHTLLLSSYSKKINQAGEHVWDALCENIRSIIGYDRVMIYQFLEDNSGQVIAENKRSDISSYFGFRFPEFDIPKQARALYLKHHVRQTWDIDGQTYAILSNQAAPFDLTTCNLRALSPIHLQYLKNAGAQASMSFSIIVQGKLWGLVACQHSMPIHVDYPKRTLGLFLTEFAVNKHLTIASERDLEFDRRIASLELKLKESMLIKSDVLTALRSDLPELAKLIDADAIVVVNKDQLLVHCTTLNNYQILELHQFVSATTEKLVFEDHCFAINHREKLSFELPFAGLLRVDIDLSRSFSIYALRNEVITEEEWAGNPEKIMEYDAQEDLFRPSPRQSFDAWRKQIHGTAPQWTNDQVFSLKRIRQIVRESILRKSEEIISLNQELIQLNNALDTYSYTVTHDLRNPLSSIKLTGQFLQKKLGKEHELVARGASNILDSVTVMENLMEKILEFSRAKVYQYEPEWVDVSTSIRKIIQENVARYNKDVANIEVKNLLPLYGEKTLFHQIFANIIGNAIKYSSKTEKAHVCIESHVRNNSIYYRITDNGIGIDADELANIYDVFKRMSNSSGFEGTGVGMAIVKRIVERLNATIDVSSELKKGTTVHLVFPNANIPIEMLSQSTQAG